MMRYCINGVASCQEIREIVPTLRRDLSRQSQRRRRALCHDVKLQEDRPRFREVLRYDGVCKTIP